jgi:hypothetical protein
MTDGGTKTNVGRDRTDETISRQFDWAETPPSVAVVRLISVAMNCDPTAIEPLGESVDPEALDRLLQSMDEGAKLQFTHLCLSILLCGDGTASVTPAER